MIPVECMDIDEVVKDNLILVSSFLSVHVLLEVDYKIWSLKLIQVAWKEKVTMMESVENL